MKYHLYTSEVDASQPIASSHITRVKLCNLTVSCASAGWKGAALTWYLVGKHLAVSYREQIKGDAAVIQEELISEHTCFVSSRLSSLGAKEPSSELRRSDDSYALPVQLCCVFKPRLSG